MRNINLNLNPELTFTASRSGGKGGQHVNKTSTKIELSFDVINSVILNDIQKYTILKALRNKLSKDGIVRIACQETRSQLQNREIAIEKFYILINKCFEVRKRRIATKPSKGAKAKRLDSKKKHSEKKEWRRSIG